ncbi:MAG: ZIP family metal transporter [Candidatus Hodarchaeales archaeon]
MFEQELTILFYSSLAGIATLLGIYIIGRNQTWAIRNSHYVNSFAAGLILALVFFHLLPESVELVEESNLTELVYISIFLGFFLFYILENFIVLHSGSEIHYHQEESPIPHVHTSPANIGLMAFSGLALHSLIDGIIIGVGFEISPEIGLLSSFAVILHEVPEGITSFALINRELPDYARILSIIVGLATPIGAVISLFFIGSLTDFTIGILLALAAGTFIYVAASDLIPETHASDNFQNLGAFLLGAVLIYVISFL